MYTQKQDLENNNFSFNYPQNSLEDIGYLYLLTDLGVYKKKQLAS